MVTATIIEPLGDSRSFQTRHSLRVAIIGGGLLGTTLALRYRQAGRAVTLFEATERLERRGHSAIASRDKALLGLLEELNLAGRIQWDGSFPPRLRFGALAGGRARIVEALRDRARAIDVDVRVGTPVREIVTSAPGFAVGTDRDTSEFDEVVMTVPSPIAADLLSSLPDRERFSLRNTNYMGIINVSFVLDRSPWNRYISRILRGRDNFVVLDPTALAVPEERTAVVYVSRPVPSDDTLFRVSDREATEYFARALPGDAHIARARVTRMPHAFAQCQLRSFTSPISGLSVVNAAHMGSGRHHLERTVALATTVFRTLCSERIS